MRLTFEEFEDRVRTDSYEGLWTRHMIQEKSLAQESAGTLVLFRWLNALGIIFQ